MKNAKKYVAPCPHCGDEPRNDVFVSGVRRFRLQCQCGYRVTEKSMGRTRRIWNTIAEDEEFWEEHEFSDTDQPVLPIEYKNYMRARS